MASSTSLLPAWGKNKQLNDTSLQLHWLGCALRPCALSLFLFLALRLWNVFSTTSSHHDVYLPALVCITGRPISVVDCALRAPHFADAILASNPRPRDLVRVHRRLSTRVLSRTSEVAPACHVHTFTSAFRYHLLTVTHARCVRRSSAFSARPWPCETTYKARPLPGHTLRWDLAGRFTNIGWL